MLTLNDGRAELWQWDTGRTLSVDADCSQAHFSNKVFGRSIDVDVVGGVAIIPDILLQTDKDLNVWAFVGTAENGYTKISKTFKVNRRNKPSDYVFTPVDQKTLDDLQSQIGDLADLTTEAKNNLVAAINEAAQIGGGGGSTVELDTTLTQSGKAADAKAVGDALAGKQDTISDLATIRSGAAKGATALQTVPSTYRTAFAQDVIDSGLGDRIEVIEGKEAGWDAKSDFSGSYNDLTDKPTIPTALPNPNALTFTGAVTGSYDGSAQMTVNIPSGGGSGGGAGAKEFRLIRSITLGEQSDRVDISVDSSGNAFALHEVYVMLSAQSYEDANNVVNFLPNGRWGSGDAYIVSANKTSKSSETWKNNMAFHSVYADGIICSEQLPAKGQSNNLSSSFAINQAIITKISLVSKFAAGCTFLVIGR